MTTHLTTPLTISDLSKVFADWHSNSLVYLADRYPDIALGHEPVVRVDACEDDSLILFPVQRRIPSPATGQHRDVLDLALEAIRYTLVTPVQNYDPDHGAQLCYQAVTAIEQVKHLRRKLAI